MNRLASLTNRKSGFTIVELLIVIVIIGILAALVIVAYTGITSRANTTRYQTDASTLIKKMEAYYVAAGAYPVTSSTANGAVNGGTGAAAVVALMNASTNKESNLPSGLSIYWVNVANTAPTVSQMTTAINASATTNPYYVSYCTTGGGVNVYYPDVSANTVKTLTAGNCP